jgi:hypothetical protein
MISFAGLGGMFGSWFGASDLEDRYTDAINELKKFQKTSEQSLKGFRQKGGKAFDQMFAELSNPTLAPDVKQLRQSLVSTISGGLSPYAQLLFEDLNRDLEGRSIATGNLRSGAIGTQRAELGRRIAADEFGRALQVMDSLQKRDLAAAGMFGNVALGYAGAENQALTSVGNAISGVASAIIGKGTAQYAKDVALGTASGMATDTFMELAGNFYTGGASGVMKGFGGK